MFNPDDDEEERKRQALLDMLGGGPNRIGGGGDTPTTPTLPTPPGGGGSNPLNALMGANPNAGKGAPNNPGGAAFWRQNETSPWQGGPNAKWSGGSGVSMGANPNAGVGAPNNPGGAAFWRQDENSPWQGGPDGKGPAAGVDPLGFDPTWKDTNAKGGPVNGSDPSSRDYGAAPSGWDANRWNDPNEKNAKYVYGRDAAVAAREGKYNAQWVRDWVAAHPDWEIQDGEDPLIRMKQEALDKIEPGQESVWQDVLRDAGGANGLQFQNADGYGGGGGGGDPQKMPGHKYANDIGLDTSGSDIVKRIIQAIEELQRGALMGGLG